MDAKQLQRKEIRSQSVPQDDIHEQSKDTDAESGMFAAHLSWE